MRTSCFFCPTREPNGDSSKYTLATLHNYTKWNVLIRAYKHRKNTRKWKSINLEDIQSKKFELWQLSNQWNGQFNQRGSIQHMEFPWSGRAKSRQWFTVKLESAKFCPAISCHGVSLCWTWIRRPYPQIHQNQIVVCKFLEKGHGGIWKRVVDSKVRQNWNQ